MSRCFLRAVVFLPAFLIPTLIGFAQRQEPDERLTPTRPGQPRSSRVASPGLRFDPRQAVGSASSIQQANTFAGSLALGSSAGTSLGASGIFLEAPLFSSGGNWANAVAVADVNGDGKRDFVAVNWGDGTLGVLLGNGDGTFQPVATYESGGLSSEAVAVADLNGDGRPDVVVANTCVTPSCDTSAISVSLGNGDGTFQPPVNYAPGGWSTSSLAIGDVNGDGKLDVIAGNIYLGNGNYSRGSVGVLLGNGNGTFQPVVSYDSGGQYAYGVALADFNGDGRLDLSVANFDDGSTSPNGNVAVFLGKGDGTFQAPVAYSSGGVNAVAITVGDANGDGKRDVFVANSYEGNGNYSTGTVGMLLGNGDGTFQVAVSYGSGGYQPISMALGDINGDGKADLLVANRCSDNNSSNSCLASVEVLAGNGDGTFQHRVSYSAGGAFATSIVLTDVNGDDKLDAVVSNQCVTKPDGNCVGNLALLQGRGDGSFSAAINYSSAGYTPNSVAVADVNGDGKPDLLIANQCPSTGCVNGTIGLLLGNGDGSFRPVVSYSSGGYQAAWVAVADVNRDGRPDLLVANQCAANTNCANGTIGVLLQNVDGNFRSAVSYGSGGYYAYALAVSDVNHDGEPDLVVANECGTNVNCATGIVGVLMGNGDGTFQPAVTYSSGGEFAFSVATGDLNGDGNPDLLITNVYASTTNQSNGTVAVLLGNGNGTFQPAVAYGSGGQAAYTAALADVNGDGKLDALVTNQCALGNCNSAELGVLLGNGDGTFQSAAITPIFQQTGIQQLAIADFDGNGTPDLASGGGGFLLLGNGDSTFQSPLLLGAAGPGIAIGDFNLDGKPDLAVGGVTILLNISTPTNRLSTTTTLTSSPNPSILGQAVTFVATVNTQSGGFPGGTVTFKDGANTVGTAFVSTCNCASRGTASLPLSTLGLGSHTMTAAYGGDVTFAGSTSTALSQTVNKVPSSTAIAASPNPSTFGQLVTVTATVTSSGGVPTGTVTFSDGGTTLGSGLLNGSGQATFTTSALAGGSHAITASYGGNSNFAGSSSAVLTETVNKANTTTAISAQSPNPSVAGQAVTVNFTVTAVAPGTGTPTGNVTVSDGVGDACTGTVASGGCALIFATAGAKTMKASYAGDSNFNTSTSAGLTHNVRDFLISSSPTSQMIKAGQKTSYKLTLTPLNGFTGSISLSCAGVPASSTCSFSAGSISLTGSSSANSTVTVQTSKTTTKGTYSLTLTGQFGSGTPTTGGLTHSVKVSLVIQ